MDSSRKITEALAAIEAHIRDSLTIDKLAGGAYLSKYHYQRIFRKAVGESVMGYVTRRRMELAMAELAETEASVLDIALGLGYGSQEGFSRSFRTHTGLNPAEYRRRSGKNKKKERVIVCAVKNRNGALESVVGELKELGALARETSELAKRYRCPCPEAGKFYSGLWGAAAERTGRIAEELDKALAAAEGLRHGHSVRLLLRAIDDLSFQTKVTSFQIGVTLARAKPQHRQAYGELSGRFENLAEAAEKKAGKISGLLKELLGAILSDMRDSARRLLTNAVNAGRAAAGAIPAGPPYDYIAGGLRDICGRLENGGLENASLSLLEDSLSALDVLDFSAKADALRMPEHKAVFAGIEGFRRSLGDARDFFEEMPSPFEPEPYTYTPEAFPLPLFFLEAELQKLSAHLDESNLQKLAGAARDIRLGKRQAWEVVRDVAEELEGMGAVLLYICDNLDK